GCVIIGIKRMISARFCYCYYESTVCSISVLTKKRPREHQADAAFVEFCRPSCSVDFCRKRPRAICSASDVADTIVDCQGKCQHTSCQACTLIDEPTCPACSQSDFRCLKKFGKCMQKFICSSRKRSCSWTPKSVKVEESNSKGVYRFPACLASS
ncbi:unnamed protein product, partial [Candidula unifasciata]